MKNLAPKQMDNRTFSCTDIMERLIEVPQLLSNVVTALGNSYISKNETIKTEINAAPIFGIKNVVMIEWVPDNQLVIQKYNREDLIKLRNRIRKKNPICDRTIYGVCTKTRNQSIIPRL